MVLYLTLSCIAEQLNNYVIWVQLKHFGIGQSNIKNLAVFGSGYVIVSTSRTFLLGFVLFIGWFFLAFFLLFCVSLASIFGAL
jgi:hypothetical protein